MFILQINETAIRDNRAYMIPVCVALWVTYNINIAKKTMLIRFTLWIDLEAPVNIM